MDMHFYEQVAIPIDNVTLKGDLSMPGKTEGVIIFSHGSGSSRFSRRNQLVAKYLHERKFGTLLFDLLTEEEDKDYHNRFDIDLLTGRLISVTRWLEAVPAANDCRIGYFGASTGAASALKAAAVLPQIAAVVSRGGRPDLAKGSLHDVTAPTLLIVGSLDHDVLQLNKDAFTQLECKKKLEVVEGATHLFEEPGKMEIVSGLAGNWFEKYLTPVSMKE
jgi:pimeloyl-ACP methyl ester carboxylesterase